MAKIQFVLIVFAVFQVVFGAPEGSVDKPAPSKLDNVIEQVKVAYNDVVAVLDKQFPNTKEVSDKFIEQARNFTKEVEGLIDNVKVQMGKNQERLHSVLSQISDKLSEHLASLKEIIGPDASARVDQVKERLEKGFQIVYDSVKSVVEAAKPETFYGATDKVWDFSMQFVDRFLNTAKVMQASLENTLKEARRVMF